MSNELDLKLINRFKNGDMVAFEELIVKYEKLIFKISNKYKYNDLFTQEDMLQELKLSLLMHLSEFEEERNVKVITYLYNRLKCDCTRIFLLNTAKLNKSWHVRSVAVIRECKRNGIQREEITIEHVKEHYKNDSYVSDTYAEGILKDIHYKNHISLDYRDNNDKDAKEDLYNSIVCEAYEYEEIEENEVIKKIIEGVERTARRKAKGKYQDIIDRDIKIFKEIAFENKTGLQLAEETNLTNQNISRIFKKYQKYAQNIIKNERSLVYGL